MCILENISKERVQVIQLHLTAAVGTRNNENSVGVQGDCCYTIKTISFLVFTNII